MKKMPGLLLCGFLALAFLGGVAVRREANGSPTGLEAAKASYYSGQDSRAFRMLHKSIFKGWLENIGGVQSAKWNFDTFTEYTILDQEPEVSGETLYCCAFSTDGGRAGYLVAAYTGAALRRIYAAETPYLYDFREKEEAIQEELGKTELDLSSVAASRVQFKDDHGVSAEGILFQDSAGREYLYHF